MRIDFDAKHHLIDVNNDETPIYRIMEVHNLFELFENKQLVLVAPKLWDDPYEDFLNHCYGVDPREPNTRISYHGYAKLLFGQCWTFNEDNDSIWRIYSPNRNRVKVRTTIKKLYSCVSQIQVQLFRSYIGKVIYLSESDIKENITKAIKNDGIHYTNLIPNFYLRKRDTFKEENEVRLMVRLYKEEKYSNAIFQDPDDHSICKLPLNNPHDFIEEIVFDPRMPNSLVRAYKSHLINTFEFQGECRKSSIYESPNLEIQVENKFFPTSRSNGSA